MPGLSLQCKELLPAAEIEVRSDSRDAVTKHLRVQISDARLHIHVAQKLTPLVQIWSPEISFQNEGGVLEEAQDELGSLTSVTVRGCPGVREVGCFDAQELDGPEGAAVSNLEVVRFDEADQLHVLERGLSLGRANGGGRASYENEKPRR